MSTPANVEKPMDNDDNERAKGKQVAGASSSINKAGNSTGAGDGGKGHGGSTDAGMNNTTNQSQGGEQSSTGGGSGSGGTGESNEAFLSETRERTMFTCLI